MNFDFARIRQHLRNFDFNKLFIEELGWDRHIATLEVLVDDQNFTLTAIAQKRGMVAFTCAPLDDGRIPDYTTKRKIEKQVAKSVHEHLIIYTDEGQTIQIWQWVKREMGKPTACREHPYHRNQPGDALIQKLQAIAFSLEEEESLTIFDVTSRIRAAFDLDRVTKRFYDRFKTEHATFLRFLKGVPDEEMQRWYASVMINRLMFIYFIQKKKFLDNDPDYLRSKLSQSKQTSRDQFYKGFLCPLFFEGFAKKESERSTTTNQMLGKVPYLNGGLFLRHQVEELQGENIQISDAAFEKLFDFFDQYQWHLDERPLRADNEINPDVLGYIFEKYINQKQMGAYYTKEDITDYISKNTVIPFLFDAAQQKCKIAFEGEQSIWRLLQAEPDRYIYPAVKKGVELPLLPEIAAGLNDVVQRTEWNRPAPEDYALPTEIWREVVARRNLYEEVRSKLENGEIRDINDLITYNLNIRQFAQDVIENCEGPELLRAFWHAIEQITVLDPTCGSGAFLFAALNILEPLYEACLDRMEAFVADLERSGEKHRPEKFSDFRKVLERIDKHPNPRYFILKSIIVNNLFGVDIMEEAVEICKLRLFLKLVAQVDQVEDIEPLPDIDFNIRSGNTLVGFATYDEVKRAITSKLDFDNAMVRIEEKAQGVDRLFGLFRQMQTEYGMEAKDFIDAKQELRKRLKVLEDELNRYLAGEYSVDVRNQGTYEKWLASHKPFHWFIEFYGILKHGGFDVIIGNPPYVEYSKVKQDYTIRGYQTESCGNLYAFVMERSLRILKQDGRFGMIVPLSGFCTDRMEEFQILQLETCTNLWLSNYAERPSKLFDGVDRNLTICLFDKKINQNATIFSTTYLKWYSDFRSFLFETLMYTDATLTKVFGIIPKVGTQIEVQLLTKIRKINKTLADFIYKRETPYVLYYRNSGGRYWKIITDFQPDFFLNGEKFVSSRESYLYFLTREALQVAIAALNSSLYYWFYVMNSDTRTNNPSDLKCFHLDISSLSSKNLDLLCSLCAQLMNDYRVNSVMQDGKYQTGFVKFQQFYPDKSKPIIDEIDRVLAQHYGLTDEELDFIINYDIKYRMGRENEEEE